LVARYRVPPLQIGDFKVSLATIDRSLMICEKSRLTLTPLPESHTIRLFKTDTEIITMSKVHCEKVSDGLRASEALVCLLDYHNKRHCIRVERDFLTEQNGQSYLPIGIVHIDPKTKAVLIELPHEAETGANRLWVKPDQLDEPVEAYA
jgi:hypothetical protein